MDETNGYQPIAETTERYLRFLRALVRSWPTPISSDRIHLQTITLNVAHNHIIDSSTSSSFGHHASMGLLDQATWTKATSPNSSVFLRANSDVRGSCQVGGAWVNFNLVEWGSFSWSARLNDISALIRCSWTWIPLTQKIHVSGTNWAASLRLRGSEKRTCFFAHTLW